MIFASFLPSPILQEYVEAYHIRHFEYEESNISRVKPYHAQPEQCLSFYIRDREIVEYVTEKKKLIRPRAELTGQHTVRINRHLCGSDFLVLIVNFRPGAVYRLTSIPSYRLVNTGIDAEAVFSPEIALVNSRLNSTDNYEEMIQIVETFLIGRFSKLKLGAHAVDFVSQQIIKSPENLSLERLASFANLCPRQFERKFTERTGVTPKFFVRMSRFNKICKLKYLCREADWLDLALSYGYHDYPHLVRDCKEFANATPVEYFFQDSKAPEHDFPFMRPEKYIFV
jgi:AraC-like DNA-binding protein